MSLTAALASGSTNSTFNDIAPGLLGFLVVAGMGVLLFFLLRNMNKQFKKIGPKPEEAQERAAPGAGDGNPAANAGNPEAKAGNGAKSAAERG